MHVYGVAGSTTTYQNGNDKKEGVHLLTENLISANNGSQSISSCDSRWKQVGTFFFAAGVTALVGFTAYYACRGAAEISSTSMSKWDGRGQTKHDGSATHSTTQLPTQTSLNTWQKVHQAAQKQYADSAPRERLAREISASRYHDIYYQGMNRYVESHQGKKTSVAEGLQELDKIADSIKNPRISQRIKKQLRVDLGLDRLFSPRKEAQHNIGKALEQEKTYSRSKITTEQRLIDNEKVREWFASMRASQKISV